MIFRFNEVLELREDVIFNVFYNDVVFNENEDCYFEVYYIFMF